MKRGRQRDHSHSDNTEIDMTPADSCGHSNWDGYNRDMDKRYTKHLPAYVIEDIEANPADYTVRLASGTVRVADGYLAPDYYYRGVCIEYVDGVNERTYGLYRTRVTGGSVRHDTLALARRWVDTELARREARGVALPGTGA